MIATGILDAFISLADQIELGLRERDTPLDEFATLPEEIADALILALDEREPQHRLRAASASEKVRERHRVGLITANALLAYGEGKARHYSRSTSHYRGASRYFPCWLTSRPLIKTIDRMARANLLYSVIARPRSNGGSRSTLAATEDLVKLVYQYTNGCPPSISSSDRPTLVLRDEHKLAIEFHETHYLRELSQNVARFNGFLAANQLGVWTDEKIQATLPHKSLYRVFNNGDWEQGGRFYGGAWQSLKSGQRRRITINGNPTVELDFRAFSPRALYHLSGIDYLDDPYAINEIRESALHQKVPWELVRKSVKTIFQFLLNGDSARGVAGVPTETLHCFKNSDILRNIVEKHQAISQFFHTGIGLRLMRRESDICEAIILAGAKSNVCVLPIHDSFIVEYEHEEWLRHQMNTSYYDAFGFFPIISS